MRQVLSQTERRLRMLEQYVVINGYMSHEQIHDEVYAPLEKVQHEARIIATERMVSEGLGGRKSRRADWDASMVLERVLGIAE